MSSFKNFNVRKDRNPYRGDRQQQVKQPVVTQCEVTVAPQTQSISDGFDPVRDGLLFVFMMIFGLQPVIWGVAVMLVDHPMLSLWTCVLCPMIAGWLFCVRKALGA